MTANIVHAKNSDHPNGNWCGAANPGLVVGNWNKTTCEACLTAGCYAGENFPAQMLREGRFLLQLPDRRDPDAIEAWLS